MLSARLCLKNSSIIYQNETLDELSILSEKSLRSEHRGAGMQIEKFWICEEEKLTRPGQFLQFWPYIRRSKVPFRSLKAGQRFSCDPSRWNRPRMLAIKLQNSPPYPIGSINSPGNPTVVFSLSTSSDISRKTSDQAAKGSKFWNPFRHRHDAPELTAGVVGFLTA